MSVIHEALKRAERERSAVEVPRVAVATASPAPPPRRRRRFVVAALGMLFLVAAGVYVSRHWDGSSAVTSEPGAVTAITPQSLESTGQNTSPRLAKPFSSVPVPAVAAVADSNPARLNSQAVTSFREGRTEEARGLLERALRSDPALPEAHNNLGLVLHSLGHRSEARAEYLIALTLFPGYPEALNNLGLAWSGEGNQVEAIRSFEKALAAKPGYSSAHLNLAIVYDRLGKKSDAFHHYRRFLDSAGAGEQELLKRVNDRLRRGGSSSEN